MDKKPTIGFYSDLHIESYHDASTCLGMIPVDYDPDIMILAGDIDNTAGITKTITTLCKRFKRVIHVCGNHEYYGGSQEAILGHLAALVGILDNYWWLDNAQVTLMGQRFVGSTMWFTDNPTNWLYENMLNDFRCIEDYKSWVYEEGEKSVDYLLNTVERDDIVITHHLPLYHSVPARWRTSEANRFFVNDGARVVIAECSPKAWIHGHTHSSLDYKVGDTRVLCNPLGYNAQNEEFEFNKLLEI